MFRSISKDQRMKFAREVGSVVLGVLIALGIGEVAEAIRWQVRVNNSMNAIRTELADNRFNVVERRAYQECIERRLMAIGMILREARQTGVIPDVGQVGRPGVRANQDAAYEVAKAEGVPLHMDRSEARDIATVYGAGNIYERWTQEELASWRTLKLLENAPGPVSSDLMASLLQAWADASEQATWIGLLAQQQDDALQRMGVDVQFDPAAPNVAALKVAARDRHVCKPLLVNGEPITAFPRLRR